MAVNGLWVYFPGYLIKNRRKNCLVHGEDVVTLIPRIAAFALEAVRLLPIVNRINRYIIAVNHLHPSLKVVYKEMYEEKNQQLFSERKKGRPTKEFLKHDIELDEVLFSYRNSIR